MPDKYFDQLKYFKDNKIISWFEDNSFRPKNNLNRAEALKIILLWFWIKSQSSWTWTFDDVKPQESIKNLNELITYQIKAIDEQQKYYEAYSGLIYYSNKGIKWLKNYL